MLEMRLEPVLSAGFASGCCSASGFRGVCFVVRFAMSELYARFYELSQLLPGGMPPGLSARHFGAITMIS